MNEHPPVTSTVFDDQSMQLTPFARFSPVLGNERAEVNGDAGAFSRQSRFGTRPADERVRLISLFQDELIRTW
jgi:hypothetical protein